MTDGVVVLSMVVGFAAVIMVGAKLGAGSPGSLTGLFAPQGVRDWPTGVQEGDAPRFVFAGAPPTAAAPSAYGPRPQPGIPAVDRDRSAPAPELLELYSGPIRD